MNIFIKLGRESLAWSFRRLYCPVKKSDLVLEVGSGGNPYYRSNVLLDAYLETSERHNVPLIKDRPIILGFVEEMPFKDDVFDFVIASHVLEHSRNPEKFISEIQRVGRAGYIEVPDAFFERLANYDMHSLEITDVNGELLIRKKTSPMYDKDLNFLFRKTKDIFPSWYSKHPFNFHVRYYWSKENGGIKYKILNPEYKFDWEFDDIKKKTKNEETFFVFIKKLILFVFRNIFSQKIRNNSLAIENYLYCKKCGCCGLKKVNDFLFCPDCQKKYKFLDKNLIDFS